MAYYFVNIDIEIVVYRVDDVTNTNVHTISYRINEQNELSLYRKIVPWCEIYTAHTNASKIVNDRNVQTENRMILLIVSHNNTHKGVVNTFLYTKLIDLYCSTEIQ